MTDVNICHHILFQIIAMPTLRVTVPRNDLEAGQRTKLAAHLTETVGQFFEEQGKGDIRPYVVVHISETAEQGYAVGGEIIG